jgi:hypothetical protein
MYDRRFYWPTVAAVLLVITLASPLFLEAVRLSFDLDWPFLASVGETYGFAAALMSSLAFLAVAYSISIQVRESRAFRAQTHRDQYFQLIERRRRVYRRRTEDALKQRPPRTTPRRGPGATGNSPAQEDMPGGAYDERD